MNGILHIHSENSLKDSPLLIKDICRKAKELGYAAAALTDHGNMTGIAEFIRIAKGMDLKPVPGVELNVSDKKGGIFHLILMAEDYTGYVGICKAVSEANRTLVNEIPVLEMERLSEFFGSDSIYHGHVIATSACERGVLSQKACVNIHNQLRIQQIQKELSDMQVTLSSYQKKLDSIETVKKEIAVLKKEKSSVVLRTGKNFIKKEEALKEISDEQAYKEAWVKLQQEKNDCLMAEKEKDRLAAKINRRNKKLQVLEKEIKEDKKLIEKREKLELELKKCESRVVSEETIIKNVAKEVRKFLEIFGDKFYLELMFHGGETEVFYMTILCKVALKYGFKTVISNDVHILEPTDTEVLKCQIMRSLKDNVWEPAADNAKEYCMKSEEELRFNLIGLVPDSLIEASFSYMYQIFDACTFEWPDEKHYPKYKDSLGRAPEEVLEIKTRENIKKLFRPGEWDEEHEKQLCMELPIIQKTGYSDYTLIISEILEEGRKGRHDGEIGCYIGPGRGSGAGSIVNYLMGITHIDPIPYGLIFERYLNIERISPPDIDSDIATSIRDLLVKYITVKYSRDSEHVGVCTITTKSRLTARAAIRAAGRVVSDRMYGNAASLYVMSDRISKAIPSENHITIGDCEKNLLELFQDDTEREIISYAKLIEGIMSGYGTHAAGMIISDSGDITDYAPVMNIGTSEEPVWNIQYDKEESEAIGLLKLDALGLTTLDVITNTMQRIHHTTGKIVDIDRIPFEKEVFSEIYAKGNTNGVFQCESAGMKKLWMQLKPDCIEDIIAGVALYRPGPMDFIDDYIKGKQKPGKIKYLTPKLKPILESTYGTIVYQEQVMRIVRDLAGFSMGRSDLVRRAMSKKKEAIMNAERKNFVYGNPDENIPGCIANGVSEEAAHKIYDQMIDFAKYAFNKSHAAAYAVVSYQSAWLKYHYPKEFMIEAMNQEKPENIPIFIEECKKYGFEVLPPDINRSSELFTEYEGKIIYGLGNVKGVKSNASVILDNRKKKGCYESFADYLMFSGANKTVTKALIQGGAFSAFCSSRNGLLVVYDGMAEKVARIKKLQARIQEKQQKLIDAPGMSNTKKNQLLKRLDADVIELNRIKKVLYEMPMPVDIKDSTEEVLAMEKAALFTYISVHPLDGYEKDIQNDDPIISVNEIGSYKIIGSISNLHVYKTKKNQEMAVFELEDKTGKIKVVCFPAQYETFKELLREEAVIRVYGDANPDQHDMDLFQVMAKFISSPSLKVRQVFVMANDEEDWEQNIKPKLEMHKVYQGSQVVLYYTKTGKVYPVDYYVETDMEDPDINYAFARRYIAGISQGKEGQAAACK